MKRRTEQAGQRDGQGGWLMAGLAVMIAIMLIFSAVAFQGWADVVQRDDEAEMIFRAQDLVRGIQRYRKEHGGIGPENLEELKEPGTKGQYYVRQVWEDPLVEDGKWGLLYAGPGGAIIDPTALGDGSGGPGLLSGLDSSRRSKSKARDRGSLSKRPGARGGGLNQGQGGRGGQEAGGLRIAGVKSLCEEKTFRVYRNQSEYKMWLFTYLDLEQRQQGGTPPRENPQDLVPPPNQ